MRPQRVQRCVVVVDLVESVRVMACDEEGTVARWRSFVGDVVTRLLPRHGGRLVKSLGDGLLLVFDVAPAAVDCALAMVPAVQHGNADVAAEAGLHLRVGVHLTDVIVDELDVYGTGVNLAARLAALAQPDQVVVSQAVRDRLTPGLDALVEDMGPCYLKHVEEPVHAFRVQPAGGVVQGANMPVRTPPMPGVAVIPFRPLDVAAPHDLLGELMADDMITRLSTTGALRVISRLSTSALQHKQFGVTDLGRLLGATFVVSGSYRVLGTQVLLQVELADARTQEVVLADSLRSTVQEVLTAPETLTGALCTRLIHAMAENELRRVQTHPLHNIEGYSLLYAAMTAMHRTSHADFEQARPMLEHLIERYPRAPQARAWLGKWFVLRVTRGLVGTGANESAQALDQTRRAIDASPDCSLALAVEGFIHCHMRRDLDMADTRLAQALAINPNDSLAWLFKCVVLAFRGQGREGMEAAERAVALSPLDPMRHYYDGLAGSAALTDNPARALELAERSLQVNRNHLPTLRVLAIAQVETGRGAAARETVARILALKPNFTIKEYLGGVPPGGEQTRMRFAAALREAGVPAG